MEPTEAGREDIVGPAHPACHQDVLMLSNILSIFYVLSTVLGSIAMNETKSLSSKSFYSNAGRQSKQIYGKSEMG